MCRLLYWAGIALAAIGTAVAIEGRGVKSCNPTVKTGRFRLLVPHHHIEEILNLRPKNGKGKPYQGKQVRGEILKYNLKLGE